METTKNSGMKNNRRDENDGTIFIGQKPPMIYVISAIAQFGRGKKEIRIKARGKMIAKAVDVAEIIKNRFFNDCKIENVRTGTESVESIKFNRRLNVSTIELTVRK
ncbi:MAG: DNA-binding protein Alba [Candidatus Aenigmatarchaeota archaeon]